jgi:hypothetical protein
MVWFNAASSLRGIAVANEKRIPRKSKAFLGACKPTIEPLEARQLLSASAKTLIGPTLVTGAVATYETLTNGTVFDKNTQKVVGPATFDGQHVVEIESTGSQPGTGAIITTYSYSSLTSAGLLVYGTTGSTQIDGTESTVTTTYSPAEVELPGRMVAGTSYTETTTSTLQVSTPDAVSTVVTLQSTVLTLESKRQSVTVPAGKYKAYVVDESITTSSTTTTTITGGSPITTTTGPTTTAAKEYYAPNAGLVEFAVGSVDKTVLVSFMSKGKTKK